MKGTTRPLSLGFWTPRRRFRIPGIGFQSLSVELGFWTPRHRFRIPGIGFESLSVELAFWIPIASGIPDSLSCIPDSKAQDSEFHKQKILRILDSLTRVDFSRQHSQLKLITVGTVSAPFLTKSILEQQSTGSLWGLRPL